MQGKNLGIRNKEIELLLSFVFVTVGIRCSLSFTSITKHLIPKHIRHLLPVYEAISFEERIEKGGSTYPWIVNVQTEAGIQPYIVKLFTSRHIQQYNPVVKEVLASALASAFDLLSPEPALVNFSRDFIKRLPIERKEELKGKDQRTKFGCRYIEGATTYSPTLNRNFFRRYDVESIFAFDNLIQNVDRRLDKPNILLHDTDSYLIDHELSLYAISERLTSDFLQGSWRYNKARHIFYEFLKKGRKDAKNSYFETFMECLRHLNIRLLDSYVHTLEEHRYSVPELPTIKFYLGQIKNNHTAFVNLLRHSVS